MSIKLETWNALYRPEHGELVLVALVQDEERVFAVRRPGEIIGRRSVRTWPHPVAIMPEDQEDVRARNSRAAELLFRLVNGSEEDIPDILASARALFQIPIKK